MPVRFGLAAALALAPLAAAPLVAQAPAPAAATFVAKAGASDRFEIESSKLVTASTNPAVAQFAQQMIADHTKSTAQVKAAAQADGMTPKPPMLDAMQTANLARLRAAKGTARDALYLRQQKPAHQKALALMQSYAAGGKSEGLKGAAGEIAPVVQHHIEMLDQMPAA